MPGWLSLATGLGRDLVAGRLQAAKKSVIATVVAYALIIVFAIASLCYLYSAIWMVIVKSTGPLTATWIMLGANVVLILIVFVSLRIYRRSVMRAAKRRAETARIGALTTGSPLQMAVQAGRAAESGFRANAKTIAATAIVLGLAVGARPELLGLVRRRR
jgi:hypothetical protein